MNTNKHPRSWIYIPIMCFNHGPVALVVIGGHELMYDIWGNAVNMSSRMDSIGQVFKTHIAESCLECRDTI